MTISNDDLKFFRGRKRKEAELMKLAEEERDFEYRRLLIEETTLDIQVAYTRSAFFKDVFIVCLFFSALLVISEHLFTEAFFGIAVVAVIISLSYKRQYKKIVKKTHDTLLLVDGVIKETSGISLPKYL